LKENDIIIFFLYRGIQKFFILWIFHLIACCLPYFCCKEWLKSCLIDFSFQPQPLLNLIWVYLDFVTFWKIKKKWWTFCTLLNTVWVYPMGGSPSKWGKFWCTVRCGSRQTKAWSERTTLALFFANWIADVSLIPIEALVIRTTLFLTFK